MPTEQRSVIVRYKADASGFNKALRNIDRNTTRAARSLGSLDRQVSSLSKNVGSLSQAFAAYYAAVQAGRLITSVAEVERLDAALEAASGSVEIFGRNLNYVRRVAEQYGLSQTILIDQFTRFSVAGEAVGQSFGEVTAQFEALATTAAAFQLSGAAIEGIMLGWIQSVGSAVINMEDLRQVADRIPGGLAIATEAFRQMGGASDVTTKEFKEFVAAGQVSVEFLNSYASLLSETFGEQAAANAKTFTAQINLLKNEFTELKRLLVDSGLLDFLSVALERTGRVLTDLSQAAGFLPGFEDVINLDPAKIGAEELSQGIRVLRNDILDLEEELATTRGIADFTRAIPGSLIRNRVVELKQDIDAAKEALKEFLQVQRDAENQSTGFGDERLSLDERLQRRIASRLGDKSSVDKLTNSFLALTKEAQIFEESADAIDSELSALNITSSTTTDELNKQLKVFERSVEYQKDYARALASVADPLKDITESERNFARATALAAQEQRDATQAIDKRLQSIRGLIALQNKLAGISERPRAGGPSATSARGKLLETFSDEVNLRNYALQFQTLARQIREGLIPPDEAIEKLDEYADALDRLEPQTRFDEVGIRQQARTVENFRKELAPSIIGGEDPAAEKERQTALGSALAALEPGKVDIVFSEESIIAAMESIEAQSQALPPEITVNIKPEIIWEEGVTEQETIGGQREES